jgi:hypothetical protein
MTNRAGKEASIWERGFAPLGLLVLLVTLFVSQFSLPETASGAAQRQRATAEEGGVAPSPRSGAADERWFPSGQAERRVVKANSGLAEGGSAGKALLPGAGVSFYPCDCAETEAVHAADDAVVASAGAASFRSRAPPAIA